LKTYTIITGDKEESILHQNIKYLVAIKLSDVKIPMDCGASYYSKGKEPKTFEEVKKEIEKNCYDPVTNKIVQKDCSIFNFLPPKIYEGNVWVERAETINDFYIKPDICTLNKYKQLESVIEIIHTNKPKYEKLIALINSHLNVVFISAFDHIDILERFNQGSFRLKCSYGWREDTPLHLKYNIAINLILKGKAWNDATTAKRIRYSATTGYHVQNYTEENKWVDSPSMTVNYFGKKAKNSSRYLEKLCEAYIKSLPSELSKPKKTVNKDDQSILINWTFQRTVHHYENPYHYGTIKSMYRHGESYREEDYGKTLGFVDQTNWNGYYSIEEEVSSICSDPRYNSNNRFTCYMNELANKGQDYKEDKVWNIEI
jgi:hypothetical protein|tara:strand:+ start:962 stop:2077 length:1116 start_codon:yes stop_codon:yes gene_type:complete